MSSYGASIDHEQALSTLLATYECMERDGASETDWIELEVAVNQAFVDAEQVFLHAVGQRGTHDDARRIEEHAHALVSLRERIEYQVALAKARESQQQGRPSDIALDRE